MKARVYPGFIWQLERKLIYLVYHDDELVYRSKAGDIIEPHPPMPYKEADIEAQKTFILQYLRKACGYESIATTYGNYLFILTRKQNEWTYKPCYEHNKRLLLEEMERDECKED